MKPALFGLLILSGLVLAACDQAPLPAANSPLPTPTVVTSQSLDTKSDDQLLQELNTPDPSLDADLKSLETELSQ